ncbi:hypothetical protein GALL_388340 [mine drainage metagenome]|uniref:Uncharacterized protein n=1 Tax=mine drainage metagenome TaxID=410659 RepID=A0A1J5QPK1_9ZZZZ
MRRRAVLQRIEQEAELGTRLVGADAQRAEHLALHLGAVDAHRAAADFPAVEHHVVGLGQAAPRVAAQVVDVLVLRRGERVMAGDPALLVVVELEHREVDDPQRAPDVVEQAAAAREFAVADLHAQRAQRGVDHLGAVGAEEQQIAVLRAAARQQLGDGRVVQVLDDRRLQTVAPLRDLVDLDPRQSARAVDLDELAVGVDLAARHVGAAGNAQRGHAPVGQRRGGGEHLEVDVAHHLGQLGELHAHAQVGLVGAETRHRLAVTHDRERVAEVDAEHVLEHAVDHLLEQRADLVLGEEGGLAVDLRELGLAVGAQVLVAETLGDLVVTVEARHHQHLLEQLRRLRQRKELAGVDTTGHQVVARAFGRALGQHRRLDVDEAGGVEEAAHRHRDAVAQHHVVLHLRPAQVEHAMRQPGRFRQVLVVELERQRRRRVQHLQRVAQHLDAPRRQRGVLGAGRARAHRACDLHAEFVAQRFGQREHVGAVGVADHLHQAFAVAQIDEDHAAVVAPALHPAAQADGLSEHRFVDGAEGVAA